MGDARGGERRIGAKRTGSGKRLMENIECALERGDGETELAVVPTMGKAAKRAGKFPAQGHGKANKFPETFMVLFGISDGAQFVEQSVEHLRRALSDRMDDVAVFIPYPIDPFT